MTTTTTTTANTTLTPDEVIRYHTALTNALRIISDRNITRTANHYESALISDTAIRLAQALINLGTRPEVVAQLNSLRAEGKLWEQESNPWKLEG